MRWIAVAVLLTALVMTCADPDPEPKKYNPRNKNKEKTTVLLTEEERKFLREVEEKFGIKTKAPIDEIRNDDDDVSGPPEPKLTESKASEVRKLPTKTSDTKKANEKPTHVNITDIKAPFPAVIAIEIVNDTDLETKGKGSKRTIDANLGYGYKTNNGYAYAVVGKNQEQKGKFEIYPYSQEDIPAPQSTTKPHSDESSESLQTSHSYDGKIRTQVEITPSQAFELVPVKEQEKTAYHYEKPAVQLNIDHHKAQSVESPTTPQHTQAPKTLYTTYNGHQFSGLSGQFPSVRPNHFVDSSQLLRTPQYQSAGLTQDHLQSHGAHAPQAVVPVLVLRIPSSYLKNPTAELYANIHQSPQISHYLNSVNLQELVHQYFRKFGYAHGPQVFDGAQSQYAVPETTVAHQPQQQYASPYVQPSHYTHADNSGVQYSAVQPVMARFPAGYRPYYIAQGQTAYRQPVQQQYVYTYRYMNKPQVQTQTYYVQPQQNIRPHQHYHVSQAAQQHVTAQQAHPGHTQVTYEYQKPNAGHSYESVGYTAAPTSSSEYDTSASVTPNYESVDTATSQAELARLHPEQNPTYPSHYPADTVAIFPRSQTGHSPKQQLVQKYVYQQPTVSTSEESSDQDLILTENYPSKDHTIATVLPVPYKKPLSEPVQTVSYVTPVTNMKFHSHYRVMVPQTVFRSPTSEKVAYVNSHSLPTYSNIGSSSKEEEYTLSSHFVPPIGSQKAPSFPRNYHAHPKRMVKSESKPETVTMLVKKTEKRSS